MKHSTNTMTVLLGLCGLLAACSSNVATDRGLFEAASSLYLQDSLFPPPAADFQMEHTPDFLRLPDAYKVELDRDIAPIRTEYERFVALRAWVREKFVNFEYTTTETPSLGELSTARQYNCLTFATLFVAAARHVDVSADFQLVYSQPYWDRENNSWINNQHINVTGVLNDGAQNNSQRPSRVTNKNFIISNSRESRFRYTVDINPAIESMRIRREIINADQVLALYYNNKSVESLLRGELGSAYQYTKAALITDAGSTIAWNNLGVLYQRIEEFGLATSVFERAVALDRDAASAKSNLARLYRRAGNTQLAAQLEREIQSYRERNPYYHAALAEQDLESGNLEAARAHLEAALKRKHDEQYFYHLLAIISQLQGEEESMIANLKEAHRYAPGADKARFANKLSALEDLL